MYLKNLDDKDNQILNILIADARKTYSDIGQEVGLSRVAVKNRVKALEEKGLIRGYHAEVDPMVIPEALMYLVNIETEPGAYSEIAERLKQESIIKTMFASDGVNRMQAVCLAESLPEMRRFMRYLRDSMPGLTHLSYYSISEIMKGTLLP